MGGGEKRCVCLAASECVVVVNDRSSVCEYDCLVEVGESFDSEE